ncbi:MAG: hypothetical protein QOE80_2948 [Actinomycetota bacterium]|nr:hypothetical protein [Actinomycetota bacterium]
MRRLSAALAVAHLRGAIPVAASLSGAVLLGVSLLAAGPGVPPAGAVPLPGAGVGCPLFPADDVWHADVSRLPVHPRSGAWLASMGGPDRRLHPDFGPDGTAQPYGIPYSVVSGTTQKVSVAFDYADESDKGPYPFGPSTPIEGGSDAHALVVDKDHCTLYELYAASWNGGRPTAGSGAIWDLKSHALRPSGWTSADAAGLPILPGLLRRDEVAAGDVDHAIRLTAAQTDKSYLWPARHQAGSAANPSLPPMGAWFRLKAGFDLTPFRPDTQVVLRAMQRHGLILADNGSNWYFTGTSEPGWDNALLDQLKTIPAGAFEAVDTSSLMADANSGRVASAPSPATTATTARPATPTTTRPKPTTTTRPKATTPTSPPTASTVTTTGATPSSSATTATGSDAETTGTAAAPGPADPNSGPPPAPSAADVAAPARGAPDHHGADALLWVAPVVLVGGFALGRAERRRRARRR